MGTYRGLVITSRKELAKAAGLNVSTLNYDLDTLKFCRRDIGELVRDLSLPTGGAALRPLSAPLRWQSAECAKWSSLTVNFGATLLPR